MSGKIFMWGYASPTSGRMLEVEAMPISDLVSVTVTQPPRQRPTDVFYFERADAAELVRQVRLALDELEEAVIGESRRQHFEVVPLRGSSSWVVRDQLGGPPPADSGAQGFFPSQVNAEVAAASLNRKIREES